MFCFYFFMHELCCTNNYIISKKIKKSTKLELHMLFEISTFISIVLMFHSMQL